MYIKTSSMLLSQSELDIPEIFSKESSDEERLEKEKVVSEIFREKAVCVCVCVGEEKKNSNFLKRLRKSTDLDQESDHAYSRCVKEQIWEENFRKDVTRSQTLT